MFNLTIKDFYHRDAVAEDQWIDGWLLGERNLRVPLWDREAHGSIPETPGVYLIRLQSKSKAYVGSTSNLRLRFGQHASFVRNGNHECRMLRAALQQERALVSFRFYATISREQAFQLEQELTDYLLPKSLLFNIGTDVRKPRAGVPMSEEAKLNMRKPRSRFVPRNPDTARIVGEKNKALFENEPWRKDAMRGALNKSARAVVVFGIRYETSQEAAQCLGQPYDVFRGRLRSLNYPDYRYAD